MNDETFLPYAKPFLNENDSFEMVKSLESYIITRGPIVESFEKAIADYCNVKYAVAFSSASSALMATYFAAKIGPQDKVITSPNTFVATVGGAMQRGAVPIFLDIDRKNGNLDMEQLEGTLSKPLSRGRMCITPVHFAGFSVDMQKMDRLIQNPDVIIIEDAAQALGSCYPTGEKVGSCCWSQMTVFSFHPAKILTTGEGGMVTTNDEELYRRLKRFRNNGIENDPQYLEEKSAPWYYEVNDLTGNFNFTEFQAALGLSQLSRLDQFIEKRRQLMNFYRSLLKDIPHLQLLQEDQDSYTAYHLCVVQIDFDAFKTTRAKVMNKLREKNIGTQVHYIPLYRHPYFKKVCGDIIDYFPQTEAYYSQALSLPLYSSLEIQDVKRVVKELKKALY